MFHGDKSCYVPETHLLSPRRQSPWRHLLVPGSQLLAPRNLAPWRQLLVPWRQLLVQREHFFTLREQMFCQKKFLMTTCWPKVDSQKKWAKFQILWLVKYYHSSTNISNNMAWNSIKLGVIWKLWFSTFWGCSWIWDLDLNCLRYARKHDSNLAHPSWMGHLPKILTGEVVYYILTGTPRAPQKYYWSGLRVEFSGENHLFLICGKMPNQTLWITKYLD